MNQVTKQELKEFVESVCHFAHAVSSVSGTDALKDLFEKSESLMNQLDQDPTIVG